MRLVKIYRRDAVKNADRFIEKLEKDLRRCESNMWLCIARDYRYNYHEYNGNIKTLEDVARYYANTRRDSKEILKDIDDITADYNRILNKIEGVKEFKLELAKMKHQGE